MFIQYFYIAKSTIKSNFSRKLQKFGASSIILAGLWSQSFIALAEESLSDQLKTLQSSQISSTKIRVETEESEAIARGLQYPSSYLIARGIITITQDERGDRSPYGVPETYIVDPELGKDDTTLFVLAVGREGPPLAAKKILNANNLKFPYLVEITADDLLFPYTKSAWATSPNSADTIAMTAIISIDKSLSTSSSSDRLGFGQSEPTNIAGVSSRTTANLITNRKIDLSLYTKDEIALLSTIDDELNRRLGSSPLTADSESGKVSNSKTGKL